MIFEVGSLFAQFLLALLITMARNKYAKIKTCGQSFTYLFTNQSKKQFCKENYENNSPYKSEPAENRLRSDSFSDLEV